MITAVVGRQSTTLDGVVNRINGLLGKRMQSPRDDHQGVYEIIDVTQVQVVQTRPGEWYGVAVVLMGTKKETLDVEQAFFSTVETET
jgi:hypothetical protein